MSHIGHAVNSLSPSVQFLTQAGDGTGNVNANGNYFGAPTFWYIEPPAGHSYYINKLVIQIVDNGVANSGDYGAIAGGLINGVTVRSRIDAVTSLAFGFNGVLNNRQLARVCDNFVVTEFSVNDRIIRGEMDFARAWGGPLLLQSDDPMNPDRIEILLSDNFTGLLSHTFTAFFGVQE